MKTTANGMTAAQVNSNESKNAAPVQCTNEECDFYWICNNMMSENAIMDEGWCNRPKKHLTK